MKIQSNIYRINCIGQGVKSEYIEYEKEIIDFIINNRKLNLPATTSLVIAKICSLYNDFNKKNKNAQLMSVYRLLKRHNLSLRKASHIGYKMPINAKNEYYDFLYETVKIRKKNGIGDKFDLIVNCDETSLYFEMIENKTIDFTEKNIIIKTNGGEKKCITCLLDITFLLLMGKN